ncbi:PAAR domain-containing protein [Arthrobacter russicus]|uniref:Zn-binding protein involved in type VI secretion n=1 Tax=Arthrobacter russicus TaxID=172040 RepID=A0ABU1J6T8_9MICC|nr:PAAR domain-containing protein [Arthrobacter russicus]MBQ1443733.1 PAAR domain-containing protein [Renibacterium sp.]MDR6268137.1 putative Zn-binding protein involved in type VI secretion [Arthrobacter russicus]
MPSGPALRAGDTCLCSLSDGPKPHLGGPLTPAAAVATVLIGGAPAAVANQIPGSIPCVSPVPNGIAQGSATVFIGGYPAARVADLSLHGQPIMPGPGCPTVIISG